ncbi:MAG: PLP-dependent aminotransferase family protein [Pirellulales bacterium]
MKAPSSTAASAYLSRRAHAAGGQPINYLMHTALSRPELISLAAGFVDQGSLPIEAVDDAWRTLAAERSLAHAALQYGTTAGYRPLRELLLEEQRSADGDPPALQGVTPEQVVVTAGSNQLLYLLADVLCDAGDIVLCAAPTYYVFLGVLKNLGIRPVSAATDEFGLIPEALEERLQQLAKAGELGRVRCIYVVSYFDNPQGVTLPAERRAQIVELARKYSTEHKIYVLDDAAYRKLRYVGDDVPSFAAFDQDDTVITTQTFSKSFSPGVHVGWGVLPPELVSPVCDMKSNIDFGSPNLSQHLIYEAVRSGGWAKQTAALCEVYRGKRDAMLKACERHMAGLPGVSWRHPAGGLYVWLMLPPGIHAGTEGPLFKAALEAGVMYVPGGFSYAGEGEPVADNTIRLSFGVQSPARIDEGIRHLATAIAAVAR